MSRGSECRLTFFPHLGDKPSSLEPNMPEPLLTEDRKRRSLFPVQYPRLFESYRKARALFWTPGEVDLTGDTKDWNEKLNDDDRHFLSLVLAFFAVSDSIVNENLAENFSREVKVYEAKLFYNFQMAIEDIHAETYSTLIETYIGDAGERARLTEAIENFPCIKKKTDWAEQWISSNRGFAERLVAFAVVEGVFFSGSFCAIFWIKRRGLMPGLSHANQLISRDEGMHQEFATMLYGMLENKLSDETIYAIVDSAVAVEIEFCTEALPVDLIGMNSRHMAEYIRYVADRLLKQLNVPKKYNASNPFPFMEQQSLEGKTNFFERRVGEYRKVGAENAVGAFTMDASF